MSAEPRRTEIAVGVPEPDPDLENGWTITPDLRVFAGHEDGFPVVWLDFGVTGTVPLFSRDQGRAVAVLGAASRRAEQLANRHNVARQDARDRAALAERIERMARERVALLRKLGLPCGRERAQWGAVLVLVDETWAALHGSGANEAQVATTRDF